MVAMATRKPKEKTDDKKQVNLNPTDADWEIMMMLQRKIGVLNLSEILRLAIRQLAVKEGLRAA